MSRTRITELTSEEEGLIPIIRDEWIRIALDTSPIEKPKAEEAIHLAYTCLGLKPPQQILWFDHPLAAANWITANRYSLREGFINDVLWRKLERTIVYFAIERRIEIIIQNILFSNLRNIERLAHDILYGIRFYNPFLIKPPRRQGRQEEAQRDNGVEQADLVLGAVWNALDLELLDKNRSFIESNLYCNSNDISKVHYLAFYAYLQAIGVDCLKLKGMWEAAKHCGLWWAFKDIAVATPKPSVIALDREGILHAEGKPAVAYEGFNVYAYHGVILPKKYGQLDPNEWRSQWLLEENNAELRRVLIQGIGYARICQQLQAVELDCWQEYVLLGIEESIDIEPIYLLKMTCPSTGYVHVLRVPPSVNSAREAIRWVNGGIDPEEFAVQT